MDWGVHTSLQVLPSLSTASRITAMFKVTFGLRVYQSRQSGLGTTLVLYADATPCLLFDPSCLSEISGEQSHRIMERYT